MYILKTKGTGKIPDYIQVRDNDFVLINHFKSENFEKNLEKIGFAGKIPEFTEIIQNLEYGELKQIKI